MPAGKTLHFKSKESYMKWVAHGQIHHLFKHKAPYEKIFIHGKLHKVKH